MKYILLYFSGTGNTKMVSRELKAKLEEAGHEVTLRSVEELREEQTFDLTDTVVGLGFPVYKFTYPEIMERAVKLLERSRSTLRSEPTPLFVYSTYCRFNATSLHKMAAAVEKSGFTLVAQKGFKCPSNGAAAMQPYDSFDYKSVMYFENRIDLVAGEFATTIINNVEKHKSSGYRERHRGTPIDNFRIKVIEEIEKWGYPKLEVDGNLCKLCSRCAKLCPDSNLIMKDDRVVVKDEQQCLHCLRCMQHCPTLAITFGEQTQGPNRYNLKTCNRLYEEAKGRASDAPEPGTPRVRRAWARKKFFSWLFRARQGERK